MWNHVFFIGVGLGLLYFGAEWLVRGSASFGLRCGMSSLMVGLTIVAFGTSAPELFVGTQASLAGQGDIAVGNVVGSNIFNIAVIVGLSALIFPMQVHRQIIKVDAPVMVGVTVVVIGVLWDRRVSLGEGVLLVTGIIFYVAMTCWLARRESVQAPQEATVDRVTGSVVKDVLLIVFGLLLLMGGSRFFVDGATGLARYFHMSEALIGLTIVSMGTSLPELASSLVAARKKEGDIALGNILGSNIFNGLCILGGAAVCAPLACTGLATGDIVFLLLTAVLLLPLMKSGFVIKRWEGGLLLAVYAGYLVYRWPVS